MSEIKFYHGDHVKIVPLEGMDARVVEVHRFRGWSEYDVRWWAECKSFTTRVFEDEITLVKRRGE